MNDPIISLNKVKKKYGSFIALNNVNLDFPRGKIIGLLGPNGSGKTTMIKLICNLLKRYEGDIKIDGLNPSVETKKIVSYLPDRFCLPDKFNIHQILEYYKDFFQDFDVEKAKRLIRELGIDLNNNFSHLSKGTKEKLQIILVLSRRAKVYIFDEPIAGVDPAARDVIFRLILNSKEKDATIIICTHLISEVETILDYAIFLKSGQVSLRGDVNNIRETSGKTLNDVFKEVFYYAPIN